MRRCVWPVALLLMTTVGLVALAEESTQTGAPSAATQSEPAPPQQPKALAPPKPAATQEGITVYFSPGGGCTQAIVDQIEAAKNTIHVQAYKLTSAPIAKAIMEAVKRGVDVTVVLDSSEVNDRYCSATFFQNQGAKTLVDPNHAIAHNKIILVDGQVVITGSFNFTNAAEQSNAENLLVLKGKADLYAAYESNFQTHAAHSVPYKGPAEAKAATTPQTTPDSLPAPAKEPNAATAAGPPKAVAPATGQPQADPTVHITKSGKKYHREGCRYLSKSDIPVKLSEAKARGFGPCSACRPPE
jgi:phosphatidylserine/phosphatidylglycerophosphate/cardiolipin synthase-like enzyme